MHVGRYNMEEVSQSIRCISRMRSDKRTAAAPGNLEEAEDPDGKEGG
jgi:hypothetical protein